MILLMFVKLTNSSVAGNKESINSKPNNIPYNFNELLYSFHSMQCKFNFCNFNKKIHTRAITYLLTYLLHGAESFLRS